MQGHASHHIVAEGAALAAGSRAILNKHGMNIDSAFNGMNMNMRYHNRLHSPVYHASVERALTGSVSYTDVAKRLSVIRAQIIIGVFLF
ncbi:hypothetical protein C7C56_018640 [Massilia glaciei]|uniref:Uncharacterized protein n=2 Tax=Massilia glaciei TaxID=1524097 RepID=A0A2U2HH92_9BURK|nr:hypothetical protein C7C56_018640 [Massilia glaciei]